MNGTLQQARAARADSLSRRERGATRRGVSLMEVLISIFILAVGLFGVAALIPVGGSEILESVKADRSAAVGAAAMRDVRVRRLLDPVQMDLFNVNQPAVPMWYAGAWLNETAPPQYVLIDPLGALSIGTVFPQGGTPQMARVNVRAAPLTSATVLTLDGAREIFVSKDDVLFDLPQNRGKRALLQYRPRTGTGVASAPGSYDPANHVPDYEGAYSWMAMLAPAPSERPYGSETATADVRCRANCSIVVFYKRNLNSTDAEVIASASLAAGSFGGGDVLLSVANAAQSQYLDRVRKNEWILLFSATGGPPPGPPTSPTATTGPLFQWYRVVAVGEVPGNPLQRQVTLSGPDWPATAGNVQAVLMQGVVGVFTKVVELDRSLLTLK